MKILVLTPVLHIENVFDRLSSLGHVVYNPDPHDISTLKKECSDADVVYTNPNKLKIYFGREFFDSFPSIKVICTASTGTTHIDMLEASKRNIKVICIKDEIETLKKVTSTADLALTLTMLANRNIINAVKDVEQGNWDYEKFIGRQFDELTVGVVGLGRLGSIYAQYLKSLGSKVLYFDPYVVNDSYHKQHSLEKLFELSNVISLHIHASSENYNLINAPLLDHRKEDLILINTSRGEIINEDDIISTLKKDKTFIYATDVLKNENTLQKNQKLLKINNSLDNLLITPHIGGMSKKAQFLAYNRAIDLLADYIR